MFLELLGLIGLTFYTNTFEFGFQFIHSYKFRVVSHIYITEHVDAIE